VLLVHWAYHCSLLDHWLHNFAYASSSVLVCLSVLTMSFPALCADSAHLPGMLTCPEVLLSLLKKSGKVFVILFPRVPPPWPATLRHQVFDDVIKIATSLVVCFLLQSQFHHQWQHHGTVFIKKIKPECPRSSASVLSHYTHAVLHWIQAIFTRNCSSKSHLILFQHGSLLHDRLSLNLTF
jgi:hypothetical protein